MAVERLAFEDPAVSYHSYHAAQHIVRYAAVKDIVVGKRVLDVACGEGYGARLLLEWGAREVVGLDISPDAIATATRQFGGKNVAFLVGDAGSLETALADVEPFDLLVSFETVEHLARPDDFLAALPGLLAPDGVIVISCPNDPAYALAKGDNPFHLKTYSFDDFRSLTQRHLGAASMWLLGAPLLGELNFRPGDEFVEHRHDLQASLLDVRPIENALALPAQSNLTTNAALCSHYIGIWGAQVRPNAVISSLSVSQYQAPWQRVGALAAANAALGDQNARLEVENAELKGEHKALSAHATELKAWLAKERVSVEQALFKQGTMAARIGDVLEPDIERLTSELSMLQQENARLTASADHLRSEVAGIEFEREARFALEIDLKAATTSLDTLEKEKAECYGPELARLKSNVEHQKFEKETQMLRRRVMAYADQSRRIGGAVTTLETKLAELERLRDSWYVPELARLSAIIEQHEKTKREWFEPQLESRAAHIQTLEGEVRRKDELIDGLRKTAAGVAAAEKRSGRIFRFKR